MAHINICSIRNKLNEVENIILSNNFHILAMSETHLDSTFEDTSLMIEGFNTEMLMEVGSAFMCSATYL